MTRYDADLGYGADVYGRRPGRRGRRTLLTLGATAAAVALFAGIVVVGFGGDDGVVHSGGVPLIQADATPVKLRPEDPGGMEVPYQDKLVYQHLNPGPNRPTVERLLPPPEQPLPRPVVAPSLPPVPPLPTPPAVAQIVPPPGATATVPRELAEDEAIPPAAAVPITAIPMDAAAEPPFEEEPVEVPYTEAEGYSPAEAPPPPPPPEKQQIAAARPPAAPAPAASTPAVAQPAKPPPAAAGGGGWRVQLASVRSAAEAEAEWKRLAGRYAGALSGLSPQITKADLGERGIYYRVRGGTVDEARARAICAELKAQNVGCVVVRP
ncbi:SPOR domain-containing protein [Azospirillum sp. A39]|uniref:SPOR domain-containing protein n=1 Tax=Azospirillum sp. A39 TaxID=3462279 RepID=UPI0040459830